MNELEKCFTAWPSRREEIGDQKDVNDMWRAHTVAYMHLKTKLPARLLANCQVAFRVCLAVAVLCSSGRSQSLLNELTTEGVDFGNGVKVILPLPSLAGKLSDEKLEEVKTQLAGNDGWEKFSRDSVVAPVTIKLEYVTDNQGTRVGHNVHSAFAVRAKLESLGDKDLMQQIFGKPEPSEGSGMKLVDLTEADLKATAIEIPLAEEQAGKSVSYSQVEFTLLDKIRLRGVMRIERTVSPNAITIGWLLDPRFANNEKLRGTWAKTGSETTNSGSYMGWGGYLNVTQVRESPEIIVIESRMLLHELPEWFSASNFIRSKLPLAIQEGARNFRRKLK